MSLAALIEGKGIGNASEHILKKFDTAIKSVVNHNANSGEDTAQLTQDEIIALIKAWEPRRDIVCLYVRWARQLRRNFNLDSIATLLCLSRQCDYTPVEFLRKVKTLSIHRNGKATYGVTFSFEIPNRKDIKNRERLSKEFHGLSVTLALLQEQVTNSPSILGKTGMRQRGPRMVHQMNIPIARNQKTNDTTITAHPTVEFHTQNGLLNRIWKSISHRWLAMYITEHLFRDVQGPWLYQDGMVYSFQAMAPCGPSRYDFLSPLAGYCLRFHNQDSILSNRNRLHEIWNDPASFISYGNTCLNQLSHDTKCRSISDCFNDLRSEIPVNCKQISYNRDSTWNRRWIMLRAYTFQFWLESTSNSNLKETLTGPISTKLTIKKKRKIMESHPSSKDQAPLRLSTPTTTAALKPHRLPPSCNGLQSITSSRRIPDKAKHNTPDVLNLATNNTAGVDESTESAPDNPALSITTTPNDFSFTAKPIQDIDWSQLRLVSSDEMKQYVQSYLLIHRLDGVDVLAELSPFEVYSADHLHDLLHSRLSARSPFSPRANSHSTFHIHKETPCFIDKYSKSYHVAREQSGYFVEHAYQLPSLEQVQLLCKAIVNHGSIDSKRAIGQYRLNFGNGGQHWVNGAPCKLHGLQFMESLKQNSNIDADQVLHAIGKITEFTWRVTCGLQHEANDHPIAPDKNRKQLYAEHLTTYLNIDQDVGYEDITLVVSSLFPVTHQVLEHRDVMNDTVAGYTRTSAFNMVMIDNDKQSPTLLHLQVICNFRKVIGRYAVPFHKCVSPIAEHARQYMGKWDNCMHTVYAGKTSTIPNHYDRTAFFLDETLEYTLVQIAEEGQHRQSISDQYLLTEVNISRTLSFSMFIDPIVKLQSHLQFDQTMELAFACSFLSNPFWFNWSMNLLLQRLDDPQNQFEFGMHPFYDWIHCTIEIFGNWQGGPYNRWSPCGGNKETILETFGAHPGATKLERDLGETKLSQVIAVLWDHVDWINSLAPFGVNPVVDMPLTSMKRRCDETIKEIARVASCQFGHFRLGIFTTILSGCGLLKVGKHLRHLMYPVKGSASFKHLDHPFTDMMSQKRARALADNKVNESISNDGNGSVEEDHHDSFMQYLSAELGFKVYLRDEIECLLCESHPMRSLNCRDWFRKGMTIYDCNSNGEFFYRDYGKETIWVKLCPPRQYKFAYVGGTSIQYISIDHELSYYAADLAIELRSVQSKNVKFKGRDSRNSSCQRTFTNNFNTSKKLFCHPSMQMADFFIGSVAKQKKLTSMFVLEDAEHAIEISKCNNLESFRCGKLLYKYLRSMALNNNVMFSTLAACCYHKDSESTNNETTFFPGHVDKPFVHTAWFVPIGETAFFTILSVSSLNNCIQDEDSMRLFVEWKSRLSQRESRHVDDFLTEFDIQAQKHTRVESPVRLIFLNKRGSLLSFPANKCYHATIIPTKPPGYPRDLLIFHPLDGLPT